jgi:capsular polysaccharide biosynthesis protein
MARTEAGMAGPLLLRASIQLLSAVLRLLAALRLPRIASALLRGVLHVRPAHAQALREMHALALARGDGPEAARSGERLLALRPDDAGIHWNLAVLALQAGDADAALRHFKWHDAQRSAGALETRLCTDSLLDPVRAATGEPYVARLRDVLVETALWSVIDGDRVYVREAHDRTIANGPYVAGRRFPDGRRFIFSLPAPSVTIEPPCVLLGGDENYSHWLTRNLIKLCLIEGQPGYAGLPLLINEDLRGYQREYLELLDIAPARLVKVPRGTIVACRDLVVPTQLFRHPRMRRGIEWLRGRLAQHMATGAPGDRLFLSRKDSATRVMLNEDALADALAALGFRTIVAGAMSVVEQVAAFSRARVVVAPHGAGLTNLMFAPPGTLVLEIASANIGHMDDFRLIAQQMDQRMVTVVADDLGPELPPDEHPMHRSYRCDVPAVMEILRRELAALR